MEDNKENHDETTSYHDNNNGDLVVEEEEEWGTLEELLLLCAINRHGTHSWDFISKELHKRIKPSSSSKDVLLEDSSSSSFSSQNCCKKYVHLKRRFPYDGNGDGEGEQHLLRMVDELRKLRVEELKRQVHNHDASIVSLQLKVKKLEEERERSKEDKVLSDLRNKPEENVKLAGKKPDEPVITGDSAENRSCNESNSTKLKCEEEPDPVGPEKNNNKIKRKETEPPGESKVSQLGELGESLSESRREQSSEVQSSASLSKKKRRRVRGGGDNNSGDELEAEEISPANKRINIKSRPLIRFFETLRSHKHGTVFNRRLPSQETEKYRNVIRQHLDLDTIQSRIDKGIYCECHPKFYRDLLLVFTNALLFYRKSSAEHIAARELRKLVIDEINQKMPKPKIQPRMPDLEPQHLEPVVKKPRSSTTMVLCRKRSSSSMQALSDSLKKGHNTDNKSNSKINIKMENGREEKVKPDLIQKKGNGSYNNNVALSSEEESKKGDVDASLKKLLAKDRSSFGSGGLRLSSNNGKKIISKDGSKREKIGNVDKEESSEGVGSQAGEKKKIKIADQKEEKGTPTLLKKQGVANFLKRMNQNSPSSQEKVKNNDFEDEKDDEETKMRRRDKTQSTRNGNVKKPSVNTRKNTKGSITRSSSRRGEKETDASRRGIGRPTKRMSSSSALDSVKGGRSGGRDSGEHSKKKPRR